MAQNQSSCHQAAIWCVFRGISGGQDFYWTASSTGASRGNRFAVSSLKVPLRVHVVVNEQTIPRSPEARHLDPGRNALKWPPRRPRRDRRIAERIVLADDSKNAPTGHCGVFSPGCHAGPVQKDHNGGRDFGRVLRVGQGTSNLGVRIRNRAGGPPVPGSPVGQAYHSRPVPQGKEIPDTPVKRHRHILARFSGAVLSESRPSTVGRLGAPLQGLNNSGWNPYRFRIQKARWRPLFWGRSWQGRGPYPGERPCIPGPEGGCLRRCECPVDKLMRYTKICRVEALA